MVVVLIAILMVDLNANDGLSVFLLRHTEFFSHGVSVHDDLIGPFLLLYVSVFLYRDGVGDVEVITIPYACSNHVDDCISQFVFYCLFPHN